MKVVSKPELVKNMLFQKYYVTQGGKVFVDTTADHGGRGVKKWPETVCVQDS